MMTEADVLRHFKAQPMELGLKALATVSEENKNISLFAVGLDGLEPSVIASIRKMRLYQETAVAHRELLLQPCHQIDAKQGQDVYEHASSHHVKHRDGALKIQGKLFTARQLLKIGLEVEEKKQLAMEQLGGADAEGDERDDDEDDDFGVRTRLPAPMVVAAPTAASMLGSLQGSDTGRKRRAAKGAPKTAAKKAKGDESDDDLESTMDGAMSEAAIDVGSLAQKDSDMAKVMAKHSGIKGRSYGCFAVLSVSNFLRNIKHGRALAGVAQLIIG